MNELEIIAKRQGARFIDQKKLAMIKRVFDATCLEASVATVAQRNKLAEQLITASGIIDDEPTLLIFARNSLKEDGR